MKKGSSCSLFFHENVEVGRIILLHPSSQLMSNQHTIVLDLLIVLSITLISSIMPTMKRDGWGCSELGWSVNS